MTSPTGGGRTQSLRTLDLLLCGALLAASPTRALTQVDRLLLSDSAKPTYLIVRSDDGGMSHSVNAVPSLVDADGFFFSTSEALHRNAPDLREVERQRELNALTSARFRDTLRARNVTLVTYRQLIEMLGMKSMRRPGEG